MAIVGDHPAHGIRFLLERCDEPPFVYEGAAFTPTERHTLRIAVAADGAVTASGEAPEAIREQARALVRTLVRHAAADGSPPPRRILRWRGEK